MAADILKAAFTREIARQIGQEAVNVINGDSDSLAALDRMVLDRLDGSDAVQDENEPVASELECIIDGVANNIQWLFNIEPLKAACPGIGPALFTIIAMRPEAGKTALWTHLVAAPGGFAWQGAKIDVIINEEPAIRTKMRAVCAATGMTEAEIRNDLPRAKEIWNQIKANINMYDAVGMTLEELDAHVVRTSPDILIVDQLDKVRSTSSKDARTDEKLREVYTGSREIAKRRSTAVVGISQLSADAHGKRNVDFSMMENSKTGKGAEADLIICGGCMDEPGKELYRQLNLSKNKITGRHDSINLKLNPLLSRYVV